MSYSVQIEHISFARHETRGEDGVVWYLILGEPDERVECPVHPGIRHHYERQGFRLGTHGHRLDATEEERRTDRANVWGWDGSDSAPTITPSFLADHGRPYRMHSFLRDGQLDLCGDSTVVLHPNPRRCWHS